MHELSITEGILETVVPEAEKHGAKRILEIRLKIGAMSGVVPACIQEYLNVAAAGTIAEGAVIKSETVPVTIHCDSCGHEGPTERGKIYCPACSGRDIQVVSGWEYYIDTIEVE